MSLKDHLLSIIIYYYNIVLLVDTERLERLTGKNDTFFYRVSNALRTGISTGTFHMWTSTQEATA
jgi:hypothetical protein